MASSQAVAVAGERGEAIGLSLAVHFARQQALKLNDRDDETPPKAQDRELAASHGFVGRCPRQPATAASLFYRERAFFVYHRVNLPRARPSALIRRLA